MAPNGRLTTEASVRRAFQTLLRLPVAKAASTSSGAAKSLPHPSEKEGSEQRDKQKETSNDRKPKAILNKCSAGCERVERRRPCLRAANGVCQRHDRQRKEDNAQSTAPASQAAQQIHSGVPFDRIFCGGGHGCTPFLVSTLMERYPPVLPRTTDPALFAPQRHAHDGSALRQTIEPFP